MFCLKLYAFPSRCDVPFPGALESDLGPITLKCNQIRLRLLSILRLTIEIENTFFLNVIDYDYNYFAKVIEYNLNNFGFMRRQSGITLNVHINMEN